MPPVIPPHPDTIRGPIEANASAERDALWATHNTAVRTARSNLEAALATQKQDRTTALMAAGLNADGSVPENYPDPVNHTAPALTGASASGSVKTCSTGGWARADSYTYQWVRDGVDIAGATANTRTLVGADVGKSLKCRVTAHNAYGTTSRDSNAFLATA